MTDPVFVIGHRNPDTDSICAAIAYAELKSKNLDGVVKPARTGEINNETKVILEFFNTDPPMLLENAKGKKLILVDHNELAQAVDGVEDAEIIEIVDHHRLGGIRTAFPIRFNAQPVGSTSTIVAKEFIFNKEKISKKTAGLLLAGILSDTVMFKSPTATEEDREIAETLAREAGLDLETFGTKVIRAKCDIGDKTVQQMVRGDLKEFDFSGEKVGIGALEIADFEDVETMRDQILREMEKTRAEKRWTIMLLLITDVMKGDSKLLLVGDKLQIVEKAFGKNIEEQSLYLENVMSRKKQVVPPLEDAFKK
jgi:manganese-dependent inorganic pyrophosphatase